MLLVLFNISGIILSIIHMCDFYSYQSNILTDYLLLNYDFEFST